MRLIKLLIQYAEYRRVANLVETLIYVAVMMGIMIFTGILCTIMEWIF